MSILRSLASTLRSLPSKLATWWEMTKSLQTGLLLLTGLAGFSSARCPVMNGVTLIGLAGSLFLAISGSTVLNMVVDRDIDARMQRTCWRSLPSGRVGVGEALALGLTMSALGIVWGMVLAPLYGLVILAGLFFDVAVYTLWLKRRTPWSIVWGGIAGGMPILAGRALGTGRIDWVGLALSMAVLMWIPTHIMTFNLRYDEDYRRVGVPTFPMVYGVRKTRMVIALSSLGTASAMATAAVGIGMAWGYLRLLAVLSIGLFLLAGFSMLRPSERVNFGLFKYASAYMLSSMLLVMV